MTPPWHWDDAAPESPSYLFCSLLQVLFLFHLTLPICHSPEFRQLPAKQAREEPMAADGGLKPGAVALGDEGVDGVCGCGVAAGARRDDAAEGDAVRRRPGGGLPEAAPQ